MSENTIVTLEAKGKQESKTTNRVVIRDFESFYVDERKEIGGNNKGPNPLEYFLGALGSCTSIITTMIAKEQNFTFTNLDFSVKGDLDPRGYKGVEGIQTYYHNVEVTVLIETEESDDALKTLTKAVEKRCPLYNLLEDAGVKVTSNWISN